MIKLSDILRTAEIKRWNIVNTNRSQSLAEHLYRVAMISMRLAEELKLNVNMVVRWALWHDVPEVLTGDIPTPTKLCLPPGVLNTIEKKTSPEWEQLYNTIKHEPEYVVVKIADLIESYIFLKHEGRGLYAERAEEKLKYALYRMIEQAQRDFSQELDWRSAADSILHEIYSQPLDLQDVTNG